MYRQNIPKYIQHIQNIYKIYTRYIQNTRRWLARGPGQARDPEAWPPVMYIFSIYVMLLAMFFGMMIVDVCVVVSGPLSAAFLAGWLL